MRASETSVERLRPDHDVPQFACGVIELDTWLQRFAARSEAMDSSRVFVGVNRGVIVGYFALTMGSVPKASAPPRLVRGLPGSPVSCVVLARFAVDRSAQGRGLGVLLLTHAIELGYRAGQAVAARLLVVDAIDARAAGFYEKFGFASIPEHPLQLFVRLEDIARSLEVNP